MRNCQPIGLISLSVTVGKEKLGFRNAKKNQQIGFQESLKHSGERGTVAGTQGAREMAKQTGVGRNNKLVRRSSCELSCPLELIALNLAKRLRDSDAVGFAFPPPPIPMKWN